MISCDKCHKPISKFGYKRHNTVCDGLGPKRDRPPSIRKPIHRIAWNKGLTKSTDERVKKHSILVSKALTGKIGRKTSDETKKKISNSRIEFLNKNPDKVPYLLNHSSKKSYPEKYFEECFSDIVENKEIQFPVTRYRLDFANPKEKLYLEIDGEQHYCDERISTHDTKREIKLNELGWRGTRIRWSHFQKLNEDEKKLKIKEIRIVMKWLS